MHPEGLCKSKLKKGKEMGLKMRVAELMKINPQARANILMTYGFEVVKNEEDRLLLRKIKRPPKRPSIVFINQILPHGQVGVNPVRIAS